VRAAEARLKPGFLKFEMTAIKNGRHGWRPFLENETSG
jgi:hypothetical protein